MFHMYLEPFSLRKIMRKIDHSVKMNFMMVIMKENEAAPEEAHWIPGGLADTKEIEIPRGDTRLI